MKRINQEEAGQYVLASDIYEAKYFFTSPSTDPEYPAEVIEEFKKGVEAIAKAQVYMQRLDWLLSGDDGEESFLRRLKEDLDKLK